MLQDIRQNVQGTAAKIVVGLIVISFSIFGIESILLGGGGGGVAEVNGEEVSPMELQQAVNTAKRRLIAMMGDELDPAMLDDERLRPQALEGLIAQKLQLQSATDMGLAVSEREVGAVIGSMEQFQLDGMFSPELYKELLASSGYTPAFFKRSLSAELVINQARSGIAGSDFATPAELEMNARFIGEQRDMRYMTIPLQRFADEREVSDAEIEAFYNANQNDFLSEETVELDYIELTPEDFYQPVDEKALLSAYEEELRTGVYTTQNRVSHILFEAGKEESPEALQARIDAVRQALDAGSDFADVAREFSDDVGSSGAGGDLGFSSGEAFPPEMEQAIAALDVGVVSSPVQTDVGTHLILVTERREAEPPTLEELRPTLESRIQQEEATVELFRTVESLRDISFNAEDLDAPAEELQLTVRQSEPVSRTQAEGLFANPSLVSAAFSEEVLVNGHNSEVIELSGNRFVVLRVRQHHAPDVRPLEAVREEIATSMRDNAARQAVTAEAERLVAAVRDGAGIEELATREGLAWQVELGATRNSANVPPQVLRHAFQLPSPAAGETLADYVLSSTGDAVVLQLVRVSAGEYDTMPEDEQDRLAQQVQAEYGSLVDAEYRSALREGADISVM
jgi:peptidyl-prolyl cis-trans isomerase D